MDEIIKVEHLSFSFGGNEAIWNVSFGVQRGDFVALVGHNGSGKTTLVKLLLGILSATKGKISLFGEDMQNFSAWEKIGYLPQNIRIFNPLFPATVEEVVALGLVAHKRVMQREEKIEEALKLLRLKNIRTKMIGELSGGQIQRMLLARAVVNQPELLILDEPVSALDAGTREEFFSYLSEFNKQRQMTIVMITHDIGSMGEYANKLLLLDKKILFYDCFRKFCQSKEMTSQFGPEYQHIICHQH
jgi:zinc transport system ATP-binding protein